MAQWIISLIMTAIPTMAIFFMQRAIKKRDDEREKKAEAARQERRDADAQRMECEVMLLDSVNASLALGEATAKAIKKNGQFKVNGEMDAALKHAQDVKHKQRDFYQRQGVEHVHRKGA